MRSNAKLPSISRLCWRLRIPAPLALGLVFLATATEAAERRLGPELETAAAGGDIVRSKVGLVQDIAIDGDPQAGRELFLKYCAICHGPRGRGDGLEIAGANVADLSSVTTQRKLNVDLLTTIHEGRPGKVMPSWKWRLSKEQSKDVLAHVRTLRRK